MPALAAISSKRIDGWELCAAPVLAEKHTDRMPSHAFSFAKFPIAPSGRYQHACSDRNSLRWSFAALLLTVTTGFSAAGCQETPSGLPAILRVLSPVGRFSSSRHPARYMSSRYSFFALRLFAWTWP